MKLSSFQAGLALLANHFENRDGYHIGAEHDQFYVYKTDRPLSAEDAARMKELGWFQENVPDDAPYDPEEGWTCYT